MTLWNDERDALLRHALARKLPFKRIAAELSRETNATFTSNACIGRAHRIGLVTPGRPRAVAKLVAQRAPKRDRAARIAANGAIQKIFARMNGAEAPDVPFKAKPDPIEHKPLLIDLAALNGTTCRWPYGDAPPFKFCGCAVDLASPYCPAHTVAAHPKPTTPEERERMRKHGEMLARAGRKSSQAARAWR